MARLQTINTPTIIYSGPAVSEFFVGCNSSSVNGCDIEVHSLHLSGEGFPLYPNSGIVFKSKHSITVVRVTPIGGDCIIDYGIVGN